MDGIIAGQEVAVKILESILRSGRIAHAYLFRGPKGSGKEALAREFSKAILCMDETGFTGSQSFHTKSITGLSCGLCRSCYAVEKNNHPDLYLIEKDGTSIKIKASYSMLKEAMTKPFLSQRKVFVIHEAENLTPEAANALLKLLEEPPSYVTFILTTAQETAMPGTVVSRCQVIPFRALPAFVIAKFLEEEQGVSEQKSRKIAHFSGGSIERAKWLLSLEEESTLSGEALMGEISLESPVELALRYSKAAYEEKARMLSVLEMEFARNLARAVQNGQGSNDKEPDMGGRGIDTALIKQSLAGLRAVMGSRQSLSANTNAFLVFCVLFLDLKRVFQLQI